MIRNTKTTTFRRLLWCIFVDGCFVTIITRQLGIRWHSDAHGKVNFPGNGGFQLSPLPRIRARGNFRGSAPSDLRVFLILGVVVEVGFGDEFPARAKRS